MLLTITWLGASCFADTVEYADDKKGVVHIVIHNDHTMHQNNHQLVNSDESTGILSKLAKGVAIGVISYMCMKWSMGTASDLLQNIASKAGTVVKVLAKGGKNIGSTVIDVAKNATITVGKAGKRVVAGVCMDEISIFDNVDEIAVLEIAKECGIKVQTGTGKLVKFLLSGAKVLIGFGSMAFGINPVSSVQLQTYKHYKR